MKPHRYDRKHHVTCTTTQQLLLNRRLTGTGFCLFTPGHREACGGQRTIHGHDVAQKQTEAKKSWGEEQSQTMMHVMKLGDILGSWHQVLCDGEGDMHGLGVVVVMHDDTKGMFSFYLWFVVILQKMFLVMAEIIRSKILPVMASQANMGSVRSACRVRLLPTLPNARSAIQARSIFCRELINVEH